MNARKHPYLVFKVQNEAVPKRPRSFGTAFHISTYFLFYEREMNDHVVIVLMYHIVLQKALLILTFHIMHFEHTMNRSGRYIRSDKIDALFILFAHLTHSMWA